MSTPSTVPVNSSARYIPFVSHIVRLCARDPGSRAALRRGLRRAPAEAVTMHKIVAPWVPDHARYGQERAYYTVASLIAAQPRAARDQDAKNLADVAVADGADADADSAALDAPARPGGNLGASLARAVSRAVMRENTAESRLHLLVRQNTAGLHRHLDGVVHYIQTGGVAVDWAQLLSDLSRWESYRDEVAKSWLRSFYRERSGADRDPSQPDGPEPEPTPPSLEE